MKQFERYLVTSALPYANGPLHLGHLAGAYLSADIYVRFQRLMGKDIVYICGSDENGAAITMRSLKEGLSPQEIVDKYDKLFREVFEGIGISFDYYHRTSDPLHHKTAQEFFKNLYSKGEFIEKESEQYYDESSKMFLADRYIQGTCPKCSYEEAYGDQCENCGSALSPTELINPISTLSKEKPVLRKTKHWYLPLDKYEGWLRKWIESGKLEDELLHYPEDWKNHVLGQCRSWLDGGLKPRSMTRDLEWGVDVPPSIEGSDGKKLYVWMDAPIGYISSTKAWAEENGKDWEPYWKDDKTALIHFIGKDNIVFHCLIFPAILKAHGEYILPVNVPANQFLNLEGRKLSTSKNWAVWVNDYLKDFPGKEDELRYALIKNMPELKDSEFTWKGYQEANNSELVNNLANFINRVIVLVDKYYEGVIPDYDESLMITAAENEEDMAYHESEMLLLYDNLDSMCSALRKYDFRSALKKIMDISSLGNQLLQFNAPWKMIKQDEETVKVVMNLSLQFVAALSVAMKPFLPFTSDKLRTLLNLEPLQNNGDLLEVMDDLAEGKNIVEIGHKIGKPMHLFSRIEDSIIEEQRNKLFAGATNTDDKEESTIKPTIAYEDFTKMDIRTATILEAEKVEKADKLLKLQVDLGFEKRTVVSGIAQFFNPNEIIGQEVLILANLAPRKIRGVESKGMILMAEDENGKLSFVSPEKGWANGFSVS